MKKTLLSFGLVSIGFAVSAATPIGGTISAPNSTGGGTNNTIVAAGSNITVVTNAPNHFTISAPGSISTPVSVANGGTSATTATGANVNIGLYNFGNVGPYNLYNFLSIAPSYSGQLGLYNPSELSQIVLSQSTSVGDWKHGLSFITGVDSLGDQDFSDPNILDTKFVADGGSPTLWNVGGDADAISISYSGNSNNSGSGFVCAVMTAGFGATNISIVSGGTGYALGDAIHTSAAVKISGQDFGAVVTGVSGSVVTALKIFASGESTNAPSGTLATTTSGGGTGLTVTIGWTPKGVQAMANNSVAFIHVPDNRVATLVPGWAELVQTRDARYNRGLMICSPSIGPDSGNYSLGVFDMVRKVFSVPKWVAGVYQPTNSAWLDAFAVDPVTGNVTNSFNTTLKGGIITKLSTKSTSYTFTTSDYTVIYTGGSGNTITLPTAVGITGQSFSLKNSGSSTVTLNTTSSQTIFTTSALASVTLAIGDCYVVVSDGANWQAGF